MIVNGGFDQDEHGWMVYSPPYLAHELVAEDAGGCQASHAAALSVNARQGGTFAQCFTNLDLATTYQIGGWAKTDGTSTVRGIASVVLAWFPRPNCLVGDGSKIQWVIIDLKGETAPDVWTHLKALAKPPAGTMSARLEFGVQTDPLETGPGRFGARFDMIYFSPAPAGWN